MTAQEPSALAHPIPDILPVLPLRNVTVFPFAVVPIVIGQERSVRLIDDVMRSDRLLVLVTQRTETDHPAQPEDLFSVGTVGQVTQLFRAPDGTIRTLVQGLERVRVLEYVQRDPYLKAKVELFPDEVSSTVDLEALRRALIDVFKQLVSLSDEVPDEAAVAIEALPEPQQVAAFIATTVPMDVRVRQEALEAPLDVRMRRLLDAMQHEIAVRELGRKIAAETQARLTRAQQEAILREQLRSIQKELGEDGTAAEVEELRRKLEEAGLPDEARKEAERELSRLATMSPASPEYGIIRTYLDWMVSLPWNRLTGGEIDVAKAREILDADHYDLEKVKERILEYLAVRKLRQERLGGEAPDASHEPILCFVGPPGVGKTSLGQSIARALGRKFVRVSLGGVHDEAEIRGHRRTYIGALPGRIVQGIRRAESRDPVFMLDEIDKVGADWRGDPSSALLEVLDPAQNHAFVDNYLGVPFDLSKVLFIATANTTDTIPAPLLDRMEVIAIAGYTEEEKLEIARRHLLPAQLRAHGLSPDEVTLTDEAIRLVIRGYTREAGVRNLDRQLAAICRKAAREVAERGVPPGTITPARVGEYLGRPRFHDETAERVDRPGVATGLAWTPVGGDVLFVEATMMPSKQERLILTGQLGEVMRESAQAALSYLRSDGARLGIDPSAFEGKTVHIHVPAGAIPKDGPSAGVTMVTALASLALGKPVEPGVAMTGEITLRGKVLPVGGIKEKVLAAHRAGIRTIILPRLNERDVLEEVPEHLRRELTFVYVQSIDEVLERALAVPRPVL